MLPVSRHPVSAGHTAVFIAIASALLPVQTMAQTASSGEGAVPTLPTVTVKAAKGTDDTTYAAPAVGVGLKLPATLRETPQSLTIFTRDRLDDRRCSRWMTPC